MGSIVKQLLGAGYALRVGSFLVRSLLVSSPCRRSLTIPTRASSSRSHFTFSTSPSTRSSSSSSPLDNPSPPFSSLLRTGISFSSVV